MKAISLLSGGLDSTLATIIVAQQGVKVLAVKFLTQFGCDVGEGSSCGYDVSSLASRFGFEMKLCHMGDEYIEMVRNPKYGRGRNMNPCIDCRIIMLNWAKEYMKDADAQFVITGEVLNQRPMSQNREKMMVIEKETGLKGLILRPLSAKHFEPTIAEQNGWVDRERLLDIDGRSRRKQLELAKSLGLTEEEYGQPSGGCNLTDPGFSQRLGDLWAHYPNAGAADITLLKVGRHFWVGTECKIIVGRNEGENQALDFLFKDNDCIVTLEDVPGPTTLVRGKFGEDELRVAAALTFRYGDASDKARIKVDGRESFFLDFAKSEIEPLIQKAAAVSQ